MAYLLDSCVISESMRKTPDHRVMDFLGSLDPVESFISSITLAEVWKGIELLPISKKRRDLEMWFETDLLIRFKARTLPFDSIVAQRWGTVVAALIRAGRPMPTLDSLLAATALTHDLTLITRNEKDFAHTGVRLFNPWKHRPSPH